MTPNYPRLNDAPHPRPVLSQHGDSPLGELVWLAWTAGPVLVLLLLAALGGR